MFKVLITGANGQVGKELIKFKPNSFEIFAFDSKSLDITNQSIVNETIQKIKPDLIINAAAYTAVDKAESEPIRCFDVNEKGVRNLAIAADYIGCPIFHISTDYVFDGKGEIPYTENDPTSPIGVYGKSKLAGELTLINSHVPSIILRTSWVFGREGNNFVKTMLRLGQERESLGIVADQYGCPTSAASIAQVLWELAAKYHQDKKLNWGIYHFCNSDKTNWFSFASEIFQQAYELKVIAKQPQIKPIKSFEYPTPAQRPEWSVLDCTKIEELLEFKVPLWKTELTSVLKELK